MITTKMKKILLLLLLIALSCMEPNEDDLWSVSVDSILQTEGFVRDISLNGSTAFLAAGQSGIQIWDLGRQDLLGKYAGYEQTGTFIEFVDLSLIGSDPVNNLIFASETNDDVKIFYHNQNDSLIYRNTIMSSRTKDFISFNTSLKQFIMYSADNDDGMKWHFYNRDSSSSFGIIFIEWTPFGGTEIPTPGKPLSIDSDGDNLIAMAVDQLGVELYGMDSLGAMPTLIGRVDTEGNAENVALHSDGVFVACDNAGASYIPMDSFAGTDSVYRFAKDLTVDHVLLSEQMAVLSLGSRGIAIYDIKNPKDPIERGIFPLGYVYKTAFWGEKLLICSREGLQVISVLK